MPRYFFDVRDGKGVHRDTVGNDLSRLEEARAQAQALLPDIARVELPDDELHRVICEVRDKAGAIVYRGELTYRGVQF